MIYQNIYRGPSTSGLNHLAPKTCKVINMGASCNHMFRTDGGWWWRGKWENEIFVLVYEESIRVGQLGLRCSWLTRAQYQRQLAQAARLSAWIVPS